MKTENWKLKINWFPILVIFLSVLFIKTFVFGALIVRGDSMHPTLQSGDYVLINKLAYIFGEPERGDVVVAKTRDSIYRVVKRVKGLPGEKFADREGVMTNVDPQEYFIVGDNAEMSVDSNEFGFVDLWDIDGRAFGAIRIKELKYISL